MTHTAILHVVSRSIVLRNTVISATRFGRVRFRSTAQAATVKDDVVSARPFEEIPMKKGYPLINNIPEFMRNEGRIHEVVWDRHQKLGPIFREKAGVFDSVMITDVEALGEFLRQEGKYPVRTEIPVWIQYRKDYGEANGVLTSKGEEWQRMRSVVDKPMMKIKTVESYADDFNVVVGDFLQKLADKRGSDGVVENIDVELFNWALESICTLLYQKRLGCLSDSRSPDTEEFVKAVRTLLETTVDIAFFQPHVARLLRPIRYRQHVKSWDTLFRVAKQNIDEAIDRVKSKAKGEEEAGFLEYLLSKEDLAPKELYANVTELMTGAVDTTSNTIQFMMYEIARNPTVQAKLLEEIEKEVPQGEIPNPKHLKNMTYLKAIIKETLRLYPVGGTLGRVVPEDAVVMGYHIPKGKTVGVSLYVMGRLPSLYDDPLTFRPERWLRENRQQKPSAFSNLPFGFGPRMCIGRRVAELEMQLLITRMLQRFRLEPGDDRPIEIRQYLITRPKDPVRVKLTERKPL